MKILFKFLLLIVGIQSVQAQVYTAYQTPRNWSTTIEVGGINPVLAINCEYRLLQIKNSFTLLRGGIGYMFTKYSVNTFPHSITFNFLLNGKVNHCKLLVGEKNQTFLETGVGGLAFNHPEQKGDYRWAPIIGIRQYKTGKFSNTRYFWKVQLTPIISKERGITPWGGIGIGFVL